MIKVKNISKSFDDIVAVDNISFSVKAGEIVGLLGANGAGKSTTMKILSTFLKPDSGTAEICGFDILTQDLDVRKNIGYIPEGVPFYPEMSPRQLLHFVADVNSMKENKEARIESVIKMTRLEGSVNQAFATLSKGFKHRLGLALAILPNPSVLILDEPTDGLDPNQRHEMKDLILSLSKEKKAIIISTHLLKEIENICSRVLIIDKGRLICDEKITDLKKKSSDGNLEEIFRKMTSEKDIK